MWEKIKKFFKDSFAAMSQPGNDMDYWVFSDKKSEPKQEPSKPVIEEQPEPAKKPRKPRQKKTTAQ